MPLGFTKYMGNLVSSTLRDGSVFAAISLFTLGLSYLLAISIYRLYFHPLAAFPGRTEARLTEWYRFYHGYIRGGRLVFEVEKTHAELGSYLHLIGRVEKRLSSFRTRH